LAAAARCRGGERHEAQLDVVILRHVHDHGVKAKLTCRGNQEMLLDEVDGDYGLASAGFCVYIYGPSCVQVCVVYVYLNAEGRCQRSSVQSSTRAEGQNAYVLE
jgi:hypothetical protein